MLPPADRTTGPVWLGCLLQTLGPDAGKGLVIAVSGGSDSIGLLRATCKVAPRLGLGLCVAHLNHGVRGMEAEADASFVAEVASSLGLPCVLGHWRPLRDRHFESDARRARFDWLVQVARERGASVVALGHTRDDQAETILHRIVRGTGLRGLAGMAKRRRLAEGVDLVRPLLEVRREEVRAWLREQGQPWREDASNTDTQRTRAKLRHELLPELAKDHNPRIVEALTRLGELAGETERALDHLLRTHRDKVLVITSPDQLVLNADAIRALPYEAIAPLIRLIWRDAGWPEREMAADHWRQIARSTGEGPFVLDDLPGVHVRREGATLFFSRVCRSRRQPLDPIALPIGGEAHWGTWKLQARVFLEEEGRSEVIDREALRPKDQRLVVRAPRDGDRFGPLGLDGHTQSINDFLRGRNVSKAQRREVPLVCDHDGIIWVVGHRIAERVRVTESTREKIELTASPIHED